MRNSVTRNPMSHPTDLAYDAFEAYNQTVNCWQHELQHRSLKKFPRKFKETTGKPTKTETYECTNRPAHLYLIPA